MNAYKVTIKKAVSASRVNLSNLTRLATYDVFVNNLQVGIMKGQDHGRIKSAKASHTLYSLSGKSVCGFVSVRGAQRDNLDRYASVLYEQQVNGLDTHNAWVAALSKEAEAVFGSKSKAESWMSKPLSERTDNTPAMLCQNESDASLGFSLLDAKKHSISNEPSA